MVGLNEQREIDERQTELEDLQHTIKDQSWRIGRVTRAYAAVERLTEEHRITGENLKNGKGELDAAVRDLENHRQVSLPLDRVDGEQATTETITTTADGGRKRSKVVKTDGASKPKRAAKSKATVAPVTTDGYAVGQHVTHEKKKGEFEVVEIIDARHVKAKDLSDAIAKPMKFNVQDLRPVQALAASA